jgi:hypothetical protein
MCQFTLSTGFPGGLPHAPFDVREIAFSGLLVGGLGWTRRRAQIVDPFAETRGAIATGGIILLRRLLRGHRRRS